MRVVHGEVEHFEADLHTFLTQLVDLCGASGEVSVGTCDGPFERPLIEITGKLPPAVRTRLRRAFAWWERKPRGGVWWTECFAVWHTSADGRGPRHEVASLGDMIDLLCARRATLGSAA
ncbi:hypothetical protein LMG29739_01657 [Paraburkholderia solisilvae]|uniref:Uncharacterized protein n=1 Tax=Paraburkholderia solisilvae TaxID=624376 RepID=A0A6J5DHW3_9BURK|nr:hypothetical protein LMG29739_01657 [Paraburkholderia solisilvae]